jgi:hypothetical protein
LQRRSRTNAHSQGLVWAQRRTCTFVLNGIRLTGCFSPSGLAYRSSRNRSDRPAMAALLPYCHP